MAPGSKEIIEHILEVMRIDDDERGISSRGVDTQQETFEYPVIKAIPKGQRVDPRDELRVYEELEKIKSDEVSIFRKALNGVYYSLQSSEYEDLGHSPKEETRALLELLSILPVIGDYIDLMLTADSLLRNRKIDLIDLAAALPLMSFGSLAATKFVGGAVYRHLILQGISNAKAELIEKVTTYIRAHYVKIIKNLKKKYPKADNAELGTWADAELKKILSNTKTEWKSMKIEFDLLPETNTMGVSSGAFHQGPDIDIKVYYKNRLLCIIELKISKIPSKSKSSQSFAAGLFAVQYPDIPVIYVIGGGDIYILPNEAKLKKKRFGM